MELIGKLVYYIDNIKKVSIMQNNPFIIGSADYCNLKIPAADKKAYFKVERSNLFFTITPIDLKDMPVFVNGEKIIGKTILTNNSEIICNDIRFIFKKEKKEMIPLYQPAKISKLLEGIRLKFRLNLSHFLFVLSLLSLSLIFFLLYKGYLKDIEKQLYMEIKSDDIDYSIRNAERFLSRFPNSQYSGRVRIDLSKMKQVKDDEINTITQMIEKSNISKLQELLPMLKSKESKFMVFNYLLNSKELPRNTNITLKVLSLVKDYESIKKLQSVQSVYDAFNRKIDDALGEDKILWINLKGMYEAYIDSNFSKDLALVNSLSGIDRELGCSYLDNMLFFYDSEKFSNVLKNKKSNCKDNIQTYKFKLPKSFLNERVLNKKIKKYFKNFKKMLNNFDLNSALNNLKLFNSYMQKIYLEPGKYMDLQISLQEIIKVKIPLNFTTCYKAIDRVSDFNTIKNMVNVCLFLDKIDKDKLSLSVYRNSNLKKLQKIDIISQIFDISEKEDFVLVKNKLLPVSFYACELVKSISNLQMFIKAISEVRKIVNYENINKKKLKDCLSIHIVRKVNELKNVVDKEVLSNKSYSQLIETKKILENARSAALDKIFDDMFYVYDKDKNDHGESAQPEIDELVSKVKEIWDKPMNFLGNNVQASIKKLIDTCVNISEINEKLMLQTNDLLDNSLCFMLNYNIGKNLKEFVSNDLEKKSREWNNHVLEFNNKVDFVNETEKKTLEIINGYRNMLGQISLKFSKSLVNAAMHHSKWMSKNGKFSHDEDDEKFKYPLLRAKYYGFNGSTIGENIIQCNRIDEKLMCSTGVGKNVFLNENTEKVDGWHVFNGWYKSSGHHRMLLCKCCKYAGIAVAKADNLEYWTFVAGCE